MMAPVYSIDSSSLIHAWNRAYRPKNFPTFWRLLEDLIDEGRLKASIEVYNELKKKDDEVCAWAKSHKESLFVEIDEPTQDKVVELMSDYPTLVDTTKGRSGGDPFVIALALTGSPKLVVVTQEDRGRMRIPDVCSAMTVECINLADLIEREDWRI